MVRKRKERERERKGKEGGRKQRMIRGERLVREGKERE